MQTSEIPNTLLYHYTTQQGLLGIVSTKTLWATDIRFLNDAKEFQYTIELAQDQLQQLNESVDRRTLQRIAERLSDMAAVTSQPRFYVSCFSANGDQLSQWRAYSNRRSGFSIGFNFANLADAIKNQEFKLIKCIYDPIEQKQIIADVMAQVLDRLSNLPPDLDGKELVSIANFVANVEKVMRTLDELLLPVASVLKHPKFDEEQEWRLVSPPIYTNSAQVHFREGQSMLVPYIEFKLPDENSPPFVPQIIVGPTPHPDHSRESLIELADTQLAIQNPESSVNIPVTVRLSEIPYRGW